MADAYRCDSCGAYEEAVRVHGGGPNVGWLRLEPLGSVRLLGSTEARDFCSTGCLLAYVEGVLSKNGTWRLPFKAGGVLRGG